MGTFTQWRRTALVAALCIAATTLGSGPARPAAAADPVCTTINQVYGVTSAGALIQHEYCLSSGQPAGQTVRPVTKASWATGGQIFSGRYATRSRPLVSVVYQVSGSGALLWYRDQGPGTSLGDGVRVGRRFGDWRRYRSLFSPGGGHIYGIDSAGRVLRWAHLGFADGSDDWQGPEVVATGYGPTRTIVGVWSASGLLVGVDRAQPESLRFWAEDGREARDMRRPIFGAAGSGPLSWAGSDVGYGRSSTGRILAIERQWMEPDPLMVWVASELDSTEFARVLAGGRWQLFDPSPYEWQ